MELHILKAALFNMGQSSMILPGKKISKSGYWAAMRSLMIQTSAMLPSYNQPTINFKRPV